MNTKFRQKAKNEFEKDFFKLMNNSIFRKTMENVRKHRDIKLVTTNKQRNQFASEPNYHSTKYISKNLLVMEMKKTEVKMNKPMYLGQAILDISKILMYEFWYDKNKKVIEMLKDKLDGKIMTEFCALRAKAYAYLMEDDSEYKKSQQNEEMHSKKRDHI